MSQRLVQPKLPTVLANDTHVDLPGHDVWLLYLENVHIIPAKLDVSKFEDALSRVLQQYPHAAGRLQSANGRWSIELTNSAIPVDIEYKLDTSTDSFLDGNWVVQDDLSPLLNRHPICVNFISGSEPLLRLKLTIFDDETCIGFTWNHSLGDGILVSRFMHMLSQFYQGLSPGSAFPTFRKYNFPMPSVADKLSYPARHFDEAGLIEPCKDSEHVRWQFDIHDLEILRSGISSDEQNKGYVSKQDCLTAYIVAVLNKVKNDPVRIVTNVSSYRHVDAPFVDKNVAGNLIMHVPANVPMDMAGIAAAIRDSLIRWREPSYIQILESSKSEYMIKSANAGNPIPFAFHENEFIVDSLAVVDWRSAHFGCPDGTRFHTHAVFMDFLRCFKSNPVKGEDGVWQVRDAIDISVGVPAELKQKMLETLSLGFQYMLGNQHVPVQTKVT